MRRVLTGLTLALALLASTVAPTQAQVPTPQSLPAKVTVNSVMSLTIVDHGSPGIDFGSLAAPVSYAPEVGQGPTEGAVTLVVGTDTNVAFGLGVAASGHFNDSGKSLSIDNVFWNTAASSSGAQRLTLSPSFCQVATGTAGSGLSQHVWYFLSVPAGTAGGNYSTNFLFRIANPV